MILLTTALAAPSMLMPLEAAHEIRSLCEEAVMAHDPCADDRSTLARASLAVAVASVLHQDPRHERAVADTWRLDPVLAKHWRDHIGRPRLAASWWVVAIVPEVPPERRHLRPARDWTVASSIDTSLWESATSIYGHAVAGTGPSRTHGLDRADIDVRLSLGGPTFRVVATGGRDRLMLQRSVFHPPVHVPWLGGAERHEVGTRHGRLWFAAGYRWGGASGLEVTAGPHLGMWGPGRGTRAKLSNEGFAAPADRSVGLEVRGRARLASRGLAAVLEPRVGTVTRFHRVYYDDHSPPISPQPPATSELQLGVTLELQARLKGGLWWTGSARTRGHTRMEAERLRVVDAAFVGTGLRWHSH